MARILVVTPDLPHPPFTGAHTRPLSLIRALAKRHDVVAVGAAAPGADLGPLEELCLAVDRLNTKAYTMGPVHAALATGRRFVTPVPLISRSLSTQLERLVRAAVSKYSPDVMQVETMYALDYRRKDLPAVIDLPDIVSGLCTAATEAHPWRYAAARPQGRAAERTERRRLAAFDAIITINNADNERLRRQGLTSQTVPLAVAIPDGALKRGRLGMGSPADGPADLAELAPGLGDGSGHARPTSILFLASFAHAPNREAAHFLARRLVPALARCGPASAVVVAGHGAAGLRLPTTTKAAARVALRVVSDPLDLAPLYRDADVVVAPLAFGGGTKNKTLEAMAWGKPVVGTAQAFTGIEAQAGSAFLQVPLDAAIMAQVVARLAAQAPLRASLGAAGREYVLAHHTQQIVDERVLALYEQVLAARA